MSTAINPVPAAAYVFRRDNDANVWQQEAKLTSAVRRPADLFGFTLDMDEQTVVVGAFQDDEIATAAGAAYVFEYDGSGWPLTAKLIVADAAAADQFGWSVGVSGRLLVVGARNHAGTGAIYSFRREIDLPGVWDEQEKVVPDGLQAGALFGSDVAIVQRSLLVGASSTGSGLAFAHSFDGCFWNEDAMLVASNGAGEDLFGAAVALGEDVAVVGAEAQDDQGSNAGANYVFRGAGNCNVNGRLDVCDIALGLSDDDDADGIPNECEADADGDGVSDALDVCPTTVSPGGVDPDGRPIGDVDKDCDVDLADYTQMLDNFGATP